MTPSGRLMSLPVPLRSVALVRGAPHAGHCPGKFVKNQYQFVSDFSFLTASCRKDTVRVKDRCNQVTVGQRSYGAAARPSPPDPCSDQLQRPLASPEAGGRETESE